MLPNLEETLGGNKLIASIFKERGGTAGCVAKVKGEIYCFNVCKTHKQYLLHIRFDFSQQEKGWIVNAVYISPAHSLNDDPDAYKFVDTFLLSVNDFLTYQGLIAPGQNSQSIFKKVFKVDSAKSLVALLDLYDETAISLGKEPLFQIQEKTNLGP